MLATGITPLFFVKHPSSSMGFSNTRSLASARVYARVKSEGALAEDGHG